MKNKLCGLQTLSKFTETHVISEKIKKKKIRSLN